MTLAYLELLPLLELLQAEETRVDDAPLRLHPGMSLAIREQLQMRGLVTPPGVHGWSAASLTVAGRFAAQKLRLDPPVAPHGLSIGQCFALGLARRQELSDPRPGRVARERSDLATLDDWRDLEARGLVDLGSPPQRPRSPGGRPRRGSVYLTRRGRVVADLLLGGAGGDPPEIDCAAPPPFALHSCAGGVG